MPSSSSTTRPKRSRTSSSTASRRSTTAPEKTEISINVYDLLPPGRLSSFLWTIGGALLHSGVAIRGREYAYGGHGTRNLTGVYWTKPRLEPPGGTFRTSVLQGFTFASAQEIENMVKEASEEFLGTDYNLLTCNCNHFTSRLCERLTGRVAPGWLNRAASVGLALPCVVPREWIAPPDVEAVDGELVDEEDEGEGEGEEEAMLDSERRRRRREALRRGMSSDGGENEEVEDEQGLVGGSVAGGKRVLKQDDTPPPRFVAAMDSSGRELPVAERAPVPKKA